MRLTQPSAVRLVLVVLSLALAGVAQALIGGGNVRWAVAPLLVGVGAIALAIARMPLSSFVVGGPVDSAPRGSSDTSGGSRRAERLLGIAGFTLSLIGLAVALFRFPAGPPNTLPWYLYGVSVVVLLLALPTLEGRWTALVSRLRERSIVSFELNALLPWIALAAILFLGLGLRLYHLDELPAGLWYDEADNLIHAGRIQDDPGSTPVVVTKLSTLYLLPVAAMVNIAGATPEAIRIVSTLFSMAGIVAVFLLARLLFGPFLALVAALVTAVMRWDIGFSRFGVQGITMTLLTAITAYLVLRALRSRRSSDFGYAGVALGLGLWFYASFRLFPLVVGFILLHYLIFQRPQIRRFLGQALIMAAVAVVVAAPAGQFAVLEPDAFLARTRETSVFSLMPIGDAIGEIKTSVGKHALMFTYEGDGNARHNLPGEPMLDFLSGMLLVLGLGIALARWRNVALVSVPIWVFVMVLPGVLTLPVEAPQALRSIGVIPAVAITLAMAFGAIWWVGRSSPWPAVRRGTPVILAALLGGIAFLNINTYFGDQARHPDVYADFSTDETLVGRHMKEQRRRGYNLYASRQYQFSAVIGVAGDNPEYEVIRAPIGIPIDATQVGRGASIYLEPREGSVYRLLRTYYPDGLFEEVRPPGGGEVLYYLAVVEKDQLEQRQGLNAVYTLADGTLRGATLPTTEAARLLDLGAEDVPFDLVWQGALLVSVPGEYQLSLQGNAPAEVMLDGRRLLWSGRTSVRIEPAVGLHSLEVTARVEEPASVLRLRWKPPDSELVAIPTRNLYRGTVRPVGLAGRFYSGGIEAGPADALRVTPALDTFDYNPVIPEPYLGVWEGTLDAPASGLYRFQVAGTGSVKLFLNGNLRAQNPGSDSNEGVPLSAGGNRIRVEYLSESPPSNFEVLWGPPGAPLGPIPIDRLTPDPERMFRLVSDGE